eukprot:643972-Amphidinium_carterae.1
MVAVLGMLSTTGVSWWASKARGPAFGVNLGGVHGGSTACALAACSRHVHCSNLCSTDSVHRLVVLEDGNVIAFGLNRGGQCNVPTTEVLRGRRTTQVACGYAHSLMLLEDGD